MLELKMLGAPQITLDGREVRLARRGSIAVLAYLVLARRPHPREALATLLAGDSGEAQARKCLSNVMVDLRRQLGAYIDTRRHSAQFNHALPYRFDVADFLGHVTDFQHNRSEAALQAAIDLYSAEFMAGLKLAGDSDIQTWQSTVREELRGQYVPLLRAHVESCVQRADWTSGIRSARRILAAEPCLEDIQRQLMLMLARAGEPRAAIAQYHACCRALHAASGATPEPETMALFNRVRATMTPLPNNLPAAAHHLVGRDEQVDTLRTLLADPECRLVTIRGLPGSGKTSLAIEAARGFVGPGYAGPEQPFPDGVFLLDSAKPFKADLSERAMLLVVDGVDPRGATPKVLSDLLSRAPGVKVLVTAQGPLHLAAERVLHVDGLVAPADTDEIETAAASALFLREALRTSPDFELAPAERRSLVRLCSLVGGFPLALVLAARRAATLPCSALVEELESGTGLDVLATTHADLPVRHRSLTRIMERAMAGLGTEHHALVRSLATASSDWRMHKATPDGATPGQLVHQLRALDQQALLRLDPARGTVELHPLLRPYAQRTSFDAAEQRQAA